MLHNIIFCSTKTGNIYAGLLQCMTKCGTAVVHLSGCRIMGELFLYTDLLAAAHLSTPLTFLHLTNNQLFAT